MARNDYETIALLEKLISGYPDSPLLAGANFLMGQALARQERYSEASQAYLNYMALRPGQIDAYVLDLRGDALFAAGDYAGARTDLSSRIGGRQHAGRNPASFETGARLRGFRRHADSLSLI